MIANKYLLPVQDPSIQTKQLHLVMKSQIPVPIETSSRIRTGIPLSSIDSKIYIYTCMVPTSSKSPQDPHTLGITFCRHVIVVGGVSSQLL